MWEIGRRLGHYGDHPHPRVADRGMPSIVDKRVAPNREGAAHKQCQGEGKLWSQYVITNCEEGKGKPPRLFPKTGYPLGYSEPALQQKNEERDVWNKVPERSMLISEYTQTPLKHNADLIKVQSHWHADPHLSPILTLTHPLTFSSHGQRMLHACNGLYLYRICSVDSSSHFLFKAQTRTVTHRQTKTQAHRSTWKPYTDPQLSSTKITPSLHRSLK